VAAFASIDPTRSLLMMSGGALLGLLLAGYSLFTARSTSTLFVPPEDVALVNQQPISRIDYLQQLQTLFGVDLEHASAEQRSKVLNDMIREELFVQRGKEIDVGASDPEVRAAVVSAVEQQIAADAITSQPDDAQLRAFYVRHRARYAREGSLTVRDYIFPAGRLQAAPPTPELAARLGGRESGTMGDEQFYFAARIHLGDRLFELARELPDGGVSVPAEEPDGIHVLYMVKNRPPLPLAFEAARDRVLKDFRDDAVNHLRTGDEQFLRKRANIIIAEDLRP
jgi:hypothetical protein